MTDAIAIAVVEPTDVTLTIDERDRSDIVAALRHQANLAGETAKVARTNDATFQLHAKAGRLRSLADIVEAA